MRFLVIGFLSLLLAGCGAGSTLGDLSTTKTNVDAAIHNNLPTGCRYVTGLHTTFASYVENAEPDAQPSAKVKAKVAAAWSIVEPICEHPEQESTATLLLKLATNSATIASAVAELTKG